MPMPMDIDNSESWTPEMFVAVVAHEGGHGIGINHAPAGSSELMAPVLNLSYIVPQPGFDTTEGQSRYGKPTAAPPTTESGVVKIDGYYNYTSDKLQVNFTDAKGVRRKYLYIGKVQTDKENSKVRTFNGPVRVVP